MSQLVALVTGTSRGVGRGLAEAFLRDGYRVVGCSRSVASPLDGPYEHRILDISDRGAVRAAVLDIERAYGRIDVLVNNAAVWLGALTLMTSDSAAERVVSTNVLGTITLTREVARVMVPARRGRIITIGSSAVPLQMEGSAVYSATKAALVQFTKVLARELAKFGITCNVVSPSMVETDMAEQLSEKARTSAVERFVFHRPATLDDVVNAVSFFAGPDSGHITGQVLYLGLTE